MALIDPSLLAGLGFLFNKTCTIQEATETQNATGEVVEAWADKAGHIAIPCVLSPASQRDFSAEERTKDRTYTLRLFKIQLQGAYPAITSKMRAVVGGQVHDIIQPSTDSQDVMTTLFCEVVE